MTVSRLDTKSRSVALTPLETYILENSKSKRIATSLLGTEVAILVNEEKVAGSYTVNFDASELASGTYIYKLITNDFIQLKKMLLIR